MSDDRWFSVEAVDGPGIARVVVPVQVDFPTDIVDMGLEVFSEALVEIPGLEAFSGHVQFVILPTVANDSDTRFEMALLRQKARDLAESMGVQVDGRPLLVDATYGVEDEVPPERAKPPAWLYLGYTTLVAGVVLAAGGGFMSWQAPADGSFQAELWEEAVMSGIGLTFIGAAVLFMREVPQRREHARSRFWWR